MRVETKARARALQYLYAWDMQSQPDLANQAPNPWSHRKATLIGAAEGEALARGVIADWHQLDRAIEVVIDGWTMGRVGVVERNILRLALFELDQGQTPPRVVIDEAIHLAHLFAGAKAPAFVNGVIDSLARQRGRL